MCNNTITKDPTTPQVCRYTTWNEFAYIYLQLDQNYDLVL